MAVNLLLLSFGLGKFDSMLMPDPLAQVFSLMIIVIGVVFLVIGLVIDKKLRENKILTEMEFNFSLEEVPPIENQEKTIQENGLKKNHNFKGERI